MKFVLLLVGVIVAVHCSAVASSFAGKVTSVLGGGSLGDLVLSLDVNDNGLLDVEDAQALSLRLGGGELSQQQLRDFVSVWAARSGDAAMTTTEGFDPIADIRHLVDYLETKAEQLFPASAIEEVHLSLTGRPSEMAVTWLTPTRPGRAVVEYAINASPARQGGNYSQSVSGTVSSYTVTNKQLLLLGLGYAYTSWVSRAVISGIPADGYVCYRCSNGTATSAEFCFASPQPAGGVAETRFAAMGDQGTVFPVGFEVAAQLAEQLAGETPPNFVLHAGDIAYAGTSDREEWEFVWDWLLRQNQQFAALAPYMTTVGNHEHYYNYSAFRHRFAMPANGNGNFWYSYDAGLVHVLSISTEDAYYPGSPQYAFIEADLQQASANLYAVPWIVAVMHRPVYCSDTDEWLSHNGDPATSQLSQYLEPLFQKYNVPLVIAGHMHVYERTLPVYNATAKYPAGATTYSTIGGSPVYVTVGTGGIFLDETWIQPQPAWSAVRASVWGTAIVTANATTLHYQFQTTHHRAIFDECFIVNNQVVD